LFLVRAGLDDLEGEVLEFGEQRPDFLRVVEQLLPGDELVRGEAAGDGLPADLAGPFGVGTVQTGRVGAAAAVAFAARVGADGEGAGQGEAGRRQVPETGIAGYIAGWQPSSMSPQAADFARAVVTGAGPACRERAKNRLWAAGRLADWAADAG
jgi:hypothetical protein